MADADVDQIKRALASVSTLKSNQEGLEKMVREEVVPTLVKLQRDQQHAETAAYQPGASEQDRDYLVDASVRLDDAKVKLLRTTGQFEGVVRLFSRSERDGGGDGLLSDAPRNDWQAEVQRTWDLLVFCRAFGPERRNPASVERRMLRLLRSGPRGIAKVFADVSTLGSEWIPDVMSGSYLQDVRNDAIIASDFQRVAMTDKNVILPWLGFGVTPYLKGQAVDDNPAQFRASSASTTSRTMEAKGVAIRTVIDDDANMDSIVTFAPILMADHARALADATDDLILNGQTAAFDTLTAFNPGSRWASAGLGTSVDHRKAWNGLRYRAITTQSSATDNSGTVSAALVQTLRAKLAGGVAGSHRDLRIAMSVKCLIKHLVLDEVETVDKIGPDATISKGDLMSIYGIPIRVTDFMSDTLESNGKYTDGSGAKGSYLLYAPKRYILGVRQGQATETARDITRGTTQIVSTARMDFIAVDASTTNTVAAAINLTV